MWIFKPSHNDLKTISNYYIYLIYITFKDFVIKNSTPPPPLFFFYTILTLSSIFFRVIQTFLQKINVYTYHILHHIDPPCAKIFKVTINIYCPLLVNLFQHSINQNKATTSTNTSAIQRNNKIAGKKENKTAISWFHNQCRANLMSKKFIFCKNINTATYILLEKNHTIKRFPKMFKTSQ